MIWAIVPAKLGKTSKERLAPVLAPELRERLARAMLTDVLQALTGCASIEATVVISRDDGALDLAVANGARALREQDRGGLNRSVTEAVRHCARQGASGVVIAMGDLPLLRPEDVAQTVRRLPERGVVLVPSIDGTGTNLVASRPAELFTPMFGPQSLGLHLGQSRQAALTTVVHECSGAALDVDTPEDLERLRAASGPRTASGELLRQACGEARAPLGG